MIRYNVATARLAVQYLVDTPYFAHRVKTLRSSVKRPRSLPFKDEAEVLNELILIGRQNIEAMEKLIALAEFKRDDYAEYMRKFMAQKRARERRFIGIQQTLLERTFDPEERRAVLLEQYETWNREKDDHLAICRVDFMNQHGGEPTWEQRNQFIKEFWALKDMELDMMEKQADEIRERAMKTKKRIVRPAPKLPSNPAIADKLMKVLAKK